MPATSAFIAFGLVVFGMALTPGPNMIYLVSRSISQGRMAGLISLGGVALGFVFYVLAAAFDITALLIAVPYAMTPLASPARSISAGSPGRRCGPAGARRFRSQA